MPEQDWKARRECEAFIERLFNTLEEQAWGAIDWEDPEQRGDFIAAIHTAWLPK